jgi:hypothetical protein
MQQSLPTLRIARIIAGALALGPVMFWAVAWVAVGSTGGPIGGAGVPAAWVRWIWIGVALPALAAGFLFRGRAVARIEADRRLTLDRAGAKEALGRVFTQLIVAWALFEGPAMMSGVFYLLTARPEFITAGAAVLLAGMVASFPRREWFEPYERVLARAGE